MFLLMWPWQLPSNSWERAAEFLLAPSSPDAPANQLRGMEEVYLGAENGGSPSPSLRTARVRKSAANCQFRHHQLAGCGPLTVVTAGTCILPHVALTNHFSTLLVLVSGVVDLED